MNSKVLENYKSINSMKDFSEVEELLKKNNIEPLEYIDNSNMGFNGNAHTTLLKDFLKINEKNNIINLKYIFEEQLIKEDFYTFFPIKKIQSDYPDEEKIHIILDYLKSTKYFNEMTEPLLQMGEKRNWCRNNLLFINSEHQKMSLKSYIYKDSNYKTLTIYEPDNYLKNTFYGLLNFVNIDKYAFFQKSLVLHNFKEITVEKEELERVKKLFSLLTLKSYRYDLEIRHDYKTMLFIVDMTFFKNNDNKCILKCENFEIGFFKTFFEKYYDLEDILDSITKSQKRINLDYTEEYMIVNVNNTYINLELEEYLVKTFLKYIFYEFRFSTLFKIKFFFDRFEYPRIITKDFYNTENNRLLLNYKIRNCL